MLDQYIQPKFTQLFKKYGVFFAYSNKQLEEQKVEGVEYRSIGQGTICPVENVQAYVNELLKIEAEAVIEMKKNHTATQIIKYELSNHECYYMGHWEGAMDVLVGYGYTEDQVRRVFRGKTLEE